MNKFLNKEIKEKQMKVLSQYLHALWNGEIDFNTAADNIVRDLDRDKITREYLTKQVNSHIKNKYKN